MVHQRLRLKLTLWAGPFRDKRACHVDRALSVPERRTAATSRVTASCVDDGASEGLARTFYFQ